MRGKDVIGLVKDTAWGWSQQQTFQHGAALAFYGVFALTPMLVIAIALAGIIFGEETAKEELHSEMTGALGPTMSDALSETINYAHVTKSGWIATGIGIGLILFASTGLFMQLQVALNDIWRVQPKPGRTVWNLVRCRLLAFVLVLCVAALLLLSLIATTVLAALHTWQPDRLGSQEPFWWDALEWLSSLMLVTLLLAMIYKLLPDAVIAWRNVWVGALLTALLSEFGNFLFGQYLVRAAPASAYGPAGSLVAVMLWVYYSSQILLFGAEFTKHFADRFGVPVRPAAHAGWRES
jgi:membrane protein